MTAEVTSLLPSGSDRELIAELVSAERWDLPAHLISDFKDPYLCPEHLLPFLAFERSVDIWDNAWSIERKRWVIDQWPRFEREKGLLAGLRDFLGLRNARLDRVITPPAKIFFNKSITPQERAAYLARFPQLRIYPFVARGHARFGTFFGSAYGLKGAFFGAIYPNDLAARDRYRRETRLFEPRTGTETVLTERRIERIDFDRSVTAYQEISLPGRKSGAIFLGTGAKARLFFGPKAVAERVILLAVQRNLSFAIAQPVDVTLKPGLEPISLRPELVALPSGPRKDGVYPGSRSFFGRCHFMPSTAWQRTFERFYLFDPTRVPEPRKAGRAFFGVSRFGMPPHHAEARVAIRGKRSRHAIGRFFGGFFITGERSPIANTIEAAAVSKRLSDRIALDTTTRRPLRAGDRIIPGVTRIGEIVAA